MLKKIPYTCILCRQTSDISMDICSICYNNLPWLSEYCNKCGADLSYEEAITCKSCRAMNDNCDRVSIMFEYKTFIKWWLAKIKSNHLIHLKVFTNLFIDFLDSRYSNYPWPDLVVCYKDKWLKEIVPKHIPTISNLCNVDINTHIAILSCQTIKPLALEKLDLVEYWSLMRRNVY